jgi:hypothetical protein
MATTVGIVNSASGWARQRNEFRRRSLKTGVHSLLSWVRPGFSVFAGEILSGEDRQELEQVARYIARPAIGMDKIRRFWRWTTRSIRDGARAIRRSEEFLGLTLKLLQAGPDGQAADEHEKPP